MVLLESRMTLLDRQRAWRNESVLGVALWVMELAARMRRVHLCHGMVWLITFPAVKTVTLCNINKYIGYKYYFAGCPSKYSHVTVRLFRVTYFFLYNTNKFYRQENCIEKLTRKLSDQNNDYLNGIQSNSLLYSVCMALSNWAFRQWMIIFSGGLIAMSVII